MYGNKNILTKPQASVQILLVSAEMSSGSSAEAKLCRGGRCLNKLGLKDRIKMGQESIGGGWSGGKKGMEVEIPIQRGGWPAQSSKCGERNDRKCNPSVWESPFMQDP